MIGDLPKVTQETDKKTKTNSGIQGGIADTGLWSVRKTPPKGNEKQPDDSRSLPAMCPEVSGPTGTVTKKSLKATERRD